jgi:hypothetical protein
MGSVTGELKVMEPKVVAVARHVKPSRSGGRAWFHLMPSLARPARCFFVIVLNVPASGGNPHSVCQCLFPEIIPQIVSELFFQLKDTEIRLVSILC